MAEHRRSAAGPPLEVDGECGLTIDLQPTTPALIAGDWITTPAGSRYLVMTARRVESRRHDQRTRYRLRCARLPRHCEVPPDVRAVEMHWYSRGRRR